MKRALFGFLLLWFIFMLVNFAWGDWRRAVLLILFPFALLLANLIAIPCVTLAGILCGLFKATGRRLPKWFGISVEII